MLLKYTLNGVKASLSLYFQRNDINEYLCFTIVRMKVVITDMKMVHEGITCMKRVHADMAPPRPFTSLLFTDN